MMIRDEFNKFTCFIFHSPPPHLSKNHILNIHIPVGSSAEFLRNFFSEFRIMQAEFRSSEFR